MGEKRELRFEPGLKLATHEEFGKYIRGEFAFPIGAEISISGICDAKCEDCFYRQNGGELFGHEKIFFKESRMEGLIYEFSGIGMKSVTWTGGGEPGLHPAFHKFVEWANWAGLEQGLFTNALRTPKYNPGLFEWIRVTKTNKNLDEGILEDLRECKTLGICINYSEGDQKEVKDALKIAEKLDVMKKSEEYSTYVQVRPSLRVRGKPTEVEMPEIQHPLLKITNYKFLGSNFKHEYPDCEAYHFVPFIWQDGEVDICAYHKGDPKFNLGNLYDKGKKGKFKQIMENAPKTVKVQEDCQICCKLNSMNSMIYLAKQLEDKNFP